MVYSDKIEQKIDCIVEALKKYPELSNKRWYALKLLEGDKITFYMNNLKSDTKTFEKESDFIFNQAIKLNAQTIRITLTRQKEKINDSCWGYKFTFIGASFDSSLYWKQNEHLYFYNFFISFLFLTYYHMVHTQFEFKDAKENNLKFSKLHIGQVYKRKD